MTTTTHETQATITAWANETFGANPTSATLVARANEEMAELIRAVTKDDNHPKLAEELADVVIVLCRLGSRLGVDVLGQEKPYIEENWHPHWLMFRRSRIESSSNACRVCRAAEKLVQLLSHILYRSSDYVQTYSLEDVAILLHMLSRELGCDLQTEVDKKMQINRQRTWVCDGSGHGYHERVK